MCIKFKILIYKIIGGYYFEKLSLAKLNLLLNNNKNTNDMEININYKTYEETDFFRSVCDEKCKSNHFYGNSFHIRNYCGYNCVQAKVEHGLYIGGNAPESEWKNTGFPAVITYSEIRYNHMRKAMKKPIFKIGPYIHYANTIYSDEEIKKIKKNNGKTLLVFPSHSTEKLKSEYNIDIFIEFINNFKDEHKFDTVLICMYYRDILNDTHKKYIKEGFKVVSAGHHYSNKFLEKLKYIISISDYTISNNIGTHIGYCVYMNKPHMIFKQNVEPTGNKNDMIGHTFFKEGPYIDCYKQETSEIINVFDFYSENITEDQYNVVNKYWGLDEIKTKEEMYEILSFCEEASKTLTKTDKSFEKRLTKLKLENKYIDLIKKSTK